MHSVGYRRHGLSGVHGRLRALGAVKQAVYTPGISQFGAKILSAGLAPELRNRGDSSPRLPSDVCFKRKIGMRLHHSKYKHERDPFKPALVPAHRIPKASRKCAAQVVAVS
jgi:hypothetical protein